MIPSNYKRTIFLVLILISFQNTNQNVEFIIENLEKKSILSLESKGAYIFYITGKLNDKNSSLTCNFTLDLETSDGNKVRSICSPYNSLGVNKILCEINTTQYPLNNIDILLPTKAPQVEKYTFKNWEQVIGAKPGISNKIERDKTTEEVVNTFTPTSITIEECLGNNNIVRIEGEWENKNDILDNFGVILISLDNDENINASCTFDAAWIPNYFECIIKGHGTIKFKDQNFKGSSKGLIKLFKIKGFDSGLTIKDCSIYNDENIKKSYSSGSFNFLNQILILIFHSFF